MRIAVCQTYPEFARPDQNSEVISDQITGLVAEGAELIVFPEAAVTGYCFRSREEALSSAVAADSQEMQRIERACAQGGVHAMAGFAERDGDHLYNSVAFYGPGGLIGVYRKTHIPTLGLDKFVKPGSDLPVFDTSIGRIGILICFDIRFPEPTRTMALRGADIVCLPTNWPESADPASDIVCPARAMENHIFVVAANRVGEENGFRFIGRSKIIAPGGGILSAADHTEQAVIWADIETVLARDKRIIRVHGEYEMDLWQSRRPDLYE